MLKLKPEDKETMDLLDRIQERIHQDIKNHKYPRPTLFGVYLEISKCKTRIIVSYRN